jgi:hypothetical protein
MPILHLFSMKPLFFMLFGAHWRNAFAVRWREFAKQASSLEKSLSSYLRRMTVTVLLP